MKIKQISIFMILLLVLLVSACAPAVEAPVAAPPAAEAPAAEAPAAEVPATAIPTTAAIIATAAPATAEPVAAEEDKFGGEVVYIIDLASFGVMDPHIDVVTQNGYVFDSVFDKLVYLEEGTLYPGLAKEWTPNEDYTTWTLKLRDDVTFHDGSKFNAEVVKFNFDRMVDPATESRSSKNLMSSYTDTEVVDEYTVNVNFAEPFPLFEMSMISQNLSMVSKQAVEEFGSAKFAEHMVGSGPFRLVSQSGTTEIVVEKNPDYNWAPAFYEHQGPAYLDKITYKWIPEIEIRVGALEMGEAQIIDQVPPDRVKEVEAEGFQIFTWIRGGFPGNAIINASIFPTDDVLVRKAMIYGFNYEKMDKTITYGYFPPSRNFISETTMFYDPACELYEYDPAKAIALLEEAGWTEINADGYRVKDGKVLEMLLYVQPPVQAVQISEAFQFDMKQIGIKINAEVISGRLHYSIGDEGSTVNMSDLGGGHPDPGLLFKSWYHSEGANYSHFANEYTDGLIEAGLATNKMEERQKIYSELQCYMMENALSVLWRQTSRVWGLSPDLAGWKKDMYPIPHMYDVHYVK